MPPTVRPWRSGAVALVVALLALAGGPAPATAIPGAAPQARVLTPLAGTSDEGASLLSDATERYIVSVYLDLFGREPDAPGLQAWTNALLTGTPRVAVANGITYSREFRAGLITDAYDYYLGRGPDPAGLEGWLGAMDAGLTIARIEAGFIASPEYFSRSGGTFEGWVSQLYADVLGRDAARAEVDAWADQLRLGASRGTVALGFLLSWEHLSTVVDGYYQHLLGRGLDAVGQRAWIQILQAGGRDEAIIGGIVASDEYWAGVNGTATHLVLRLDAAETEAGRHVAHQVFAANRWGDALADVSRAAVVTASTDRSWCDSSGCAVFEAGTHEITAEWAGLVGDATISVVPGPLKDLVLTPALSDVVAGARPTFAVTGLDEYGNSHGDVTAISTLKVDDDERACVRTTCTLTTVGTHVIVAYTSRGGWGDHVVDVTYPDAPTGASLFGWGGGGWYAVLGAPTIGVPVTPYQADTDDSWTAVEGGESHSVGIRTDGSLWAWGANDGMQVGGPGVHDTTRPTLVDDVHDWDAVTAAGGHSLALTDDGTLWGWGRNAYGQLGLDSGGEPSALRAVAGGATWAHVATAVTHSAAIRVDGSLWTWGSGAQGQLGLGDLAGRTEPTRVGTERWTSVAVGTYYTLAVRSDGTLWGWGTGARGELGEPGSGAVTTPRQIGTGTTWATVTAATAVAGGIQQDGSLWVWGSSATGVPPGDPSGPDTAVPPAQVGTGAQWASVSFVRDVAVALTDEGALWSWGQNTRGHVGDGTWTPRPTLVQIQPGTTWSSVATGSHHVLALRAP